MRLLLLCCLAVLGEPTRDILEGAAVQRVLGAGGTGEVGPEGMDTSRSTGQRDKDLGLSLRPASHGMCGPVTASPFWAHYLHICKMG